MDAVEKADSQWGDRRPLAALLANHSIEVMPRTAAAIDDFRAILVPGTRVFIAHIDGVAGEDMVRCAARIAREGFPVVPHFPARSIASRQVLGELVQRYQGEAGCSQALLLAGSIAKPRGPFGSSLHLLETGLFDKAGFSHMFFAGHPEGSREIDPDGSGKNARTAIMAKQAAAANSDAEFALVTQFCFDAGSVMRWIDGLAHAGVTLPLHIGIAGPARLQTLIKFALSCGVGPSLGVLRKRARDLGRLLLPHTPEGVLTDFAAQATPAATKNVAGLHFFPLGGIRATTGWIAEHGG